MSVSNGSIGGSRRSRPGQSGASQYLRGIRARTRAYLPSAAFCLSMCLSAAALYQFRGGVFSAGVLAFNSLIAAFAVGLATALIVKS